MNSSIDFRNVFLKVLLPLSVICVLIACVDFYMGRQWGKLNSDIMRIYEEGKHFEAVALAERTYQLALESLGEEDPDTLVTMSNLGLLYYYQERYADAEPLLNKVLRLKKKVLGNEDPETLVSINNLGLLYYSLGEYGQAEVLFKRALKLSKKVFGMEHPITITSINNLAAFYRTRLHYPDAMHLLVDDSRKL